MTHPLRLMYELYKLLGIKKISTTAYHPHTDGLVERLNQTLIDMLSKRVHPSGKDWDTASVYVLAIYCLSENQTSELLLNQAKMLITTPTKTLKIPQISVYHTL